MTNDQKDEKLVQAYQVIGHMAGGDVPLAEMRRALDYFASDEFDPDFLPWPRQE